MKPRIRAIYVVSAIALVAVPSLGATKQHSQNLIVNLPSASSVLGRFGAEAMYLHDLGDGRTMLYVENQGGHSLSILDVTDPAAISLAGAAELSAKGSFDFVSTLSDDGVLIRYRESADFALINLRHWKRPAIVEEPHLTTSTGAEVLGSRGLLLTSESVRPVLTRVNRTYDVIDTTDLSHPFIVATISGVTQRILKSDTGTMFLLNASGITVVRRLSSEQSAAERENPTN